MDYLKAGQGFSLIHICTPGALTASRYIATLFERTTLRTNSFILSSKPAVIQTYIHEQFAQKCCQFKYNRTMPLSTQ